MRELHIRRLHSEYIALTREAISVYLRRPKSFAVLGVPCRLLLARTDYPRRLTKLGSSVCCRNEGRWKTSGTPCWRTQPTPPTTPHITLPRECGGARSMAHGCGVRYHTVHNLTSLCRGVVACFPNENCRPWDACCLPGNYKRPGDFLAVGHSFTAGLLLLHVRKV